jgi:hypothetical protein
MTAALVLCPVIARSQVSSLGEYQVKAAFLYNFTQFVSWNGELPNDTNVGFKIGIYGEDPFGLTLDSLVKGERVGALPIHVIRSTEVRRLDSCQIVFVPESKIGDVQLNAVLDRLKRPGTLLVGEQKGFAEQGGAIELMVEKSRVNFIINMDSVRGAGLEASSKLQRVAKQVLD